MGFPGGFPETTSLSVRYRFLPAAMKLGQGNVFTGVCDSVHRWGVGVCLSARWDTPRSRQPPPPRSRHTPPRADTPWRRHPPGSRLRHNTVNERPVRILLECILIVLVLNFLGGHMPYFRLGDVTSGF